MSRNILLTISYMISFNLKKVASVAITRIIISLASAWHVYLLQHRVWTRDQNPCITENGPRRWEPDIKKAHLIQLLADFRVFTYNFFPRSYLNYIFRNYFLLNSKIESSMNYFSFIFAFIQFRIKTEINCCITKNACIIASCCMLTGNDQRLDHLPSTQGIFSMDTTVLFPNES